MAPRRGERGMALIAVLLLLLVSLAVGLLSANASRTEVAIAHNQVLELRALAVAEAGMAMAKKLIENRYGIVDNELALNTGCTCATSECNFGVGNGNSGLAALGSLANMTFADDNSVARCYRFAALGGAGTDGYYVRVEDNNDDASKTTDSDQAIRVISHGVIGTAERVVVAMFNITPGSPPSGGPGIFGRDGVGFGGNGGYADSYTGTWPSMTYTHDAVVQSNVNVDMGSDTHVYGDEISGGTVTGNMPIDGTVTTGAPLLTFAPVAACGPPYSGTSGIHFAGSGTYDTGSGKLVCGSSCGTLTLDPGTYCFGQVTLSGGANLRVTGPTVVNVTDQFKGGGGGLENTTGDPSNFKLNTSVVGKDAVVINGGSQAFMEVYAPSGEVVVGGGGDYWGTIVGSKVDFTGGSKYHQPVGGGGGGGTPGVVSMSSWHEVQN